MTMFQKPNVAIAFTPAGEGDEPVIEPSVEQWASTPARRWALATLLSVLCVFTYIYPTFSGTFLPGDDGTVRNNAVLYNFEGLKTIWGLPQRLPELSPVSYTVLLIEHQFFGSRPRGYHIISILLQARNALLLWLLLRRLELPGAWLGAALFAVHPVQVDTVSWISQQRYLICGAFYFSALLIYLRRAGLNPQPLPPLPGTEPLIQIGLPENRIALFTFSIILFVLAVLSHILGTTFPLVVLILIWWERGKISREDIIPLIPFAVLSLAFAIIAAVLSYYRAGTLWITNPGALNVLIVWGHGVWSYFLATILPISLSFAYPKWTADSIYLWQWIFPITAIAVVIALWMLRRQWGRGPITAALLFICLLLPAALGASDPQDSELPGVMVREHAIYLACAAALVPLAVLLTGVLTESKFSAKLAAFPGIVPGISAIILLPLAIGASVHTGAYNDETSLWQNVLHVDSKSTIALNTLGQLELTAKDYGAANQHFLAAYRANPDDAQSQINLARVAENQKDFGSAIARYDEVLHRHPNNLDAHFGLGEALSAQGNTKGALGEYELVQQIDPHNALVFNNIGLIYAQLGELDEAIAQYKKSIERDPRSMPAYLNMANAQFQQGKFSDAKDTLERALHIDPQNYVAWLNAGVMAEAVGDAHSAEIYFRTAIYYKFDSADAFNDLGMVLMRQGDAPGKTDHIGEAIYCFKRASELDPNNTSAAQNKVIAQRKKDEIVRLQQQQ